MSTVKTIGLAVLMGAVLTGSALAQDNKVIIVQSTTSTANSGFYEYILPIIKEKTGVTANVVAVGTGQAIKNAQNCDADVLLVHAKAAEEQFVAEGYGAARTDLMYNDFVIVGPEADPAGISGSTDVTAALKVIAEKKAPFASRADDSGTHKAEIALWSAAGVDPKTGSGDWYRETGSGMGATLNTAVGMGAYALTDRATWATFENKGDFAVDVEGDERLFNQYGIIPVNPAKCPNVKVEAAKAFTDYLLSEEGQKNIEAFQVNGQPLFFPNAPVTMMKKAG